MLDIAAFTGALTTLGSLMKIANESKNVPMTDKLIELQQKIITMQGDFGEMQQKLFEVQQENRELKEKQRGGEDFATFRATLKYVESSGIWTRDVGGTLEAYCGACLNDGKKIRLSKDGRTYVCQNHGFRN
jgi:hypothetical protein